MSTPLDKHGYAMSESSPDGRYRLILGFATLDDLQAAHEYVVKSKPCECGYGGCTKCYPTQETSPVLDHKHLPDPYDPGICQKCGCLRASHRQEEPCLNGPLNDAVNALQPGQALHMTRECDGAEFTVMLSDDLEHIAKLGGLRVKDLP